MDKLYDCPGIYRLPIPIPDNPLKSLNSYVIFTGDRPLVIDTGFNRPACREALLAGLHELGLRPGDCDLFLTHMHCDHSGLAPLFSREGSRIFMGEKDYALAMHRLTPQGWDYMEELFLRHGFPASRLSRQRQENQARIYAPAEPFPAQLVQDGELLTLGGFSFRCIETPGHSPGHMCLYLEDEALLFTGDSVLYTITPNVSPWDGSGSPLHDFLGSLEKLKKLRVRRGLPAHRQEGDFYSRLEELAEHHARRLEELESLLERDRPQSAYALAQKLTWSSRGKAWEDFSPNQQWFATGETMVHLEYLFLEGRATPETGPDPERPGRDRLLARKP